MTPPRIGDVSSIIDPPHPRTSPPTIIDQNAVKRYMENERLAKQMGVYFTQLCQLRDAMGQDHLTKLLNESRKERLERIKETRRDNRKATRGVR